MRELYAKQRDKDEIDVFVDGILANPARADELKNQLRDRLRVVERSEPEASDDLDDLWENVPV